MRTRRFVVAGLLVVLGMAGLASPWAGSSPDGLERVAVDAGFADAATEHPLSEGPVAGYTVTGVADERVATALAGIAGVLLTFGLALGVFTLLRPPRRRDE